MPLNHYIAPNVFVVIFVFDFLVMSCLLILLINCQKGQKLKRHLLSQSLYQRQGHLSSCPNAISRLDSPNCQIFLFLSWPRFSFAAAMLWEQYNTCPKKIIRWVRRSTMSFTRGWRRDHLGGGRWDILSFNRQLRIKCQNHGIQNSPYTLLLDNSGF